MTVTRRVLLARGGGGSFTPPPSTWVLTTADNGGWTHANAPKAWEHDGVVYFTYVDMANGNLEVAGFDPVAATTTSATVIAAAFEADMHAAASLRAREDGRLVIVYSAHDGGTLRQRVTTNPLPDLTLDAAETIDTGRLFTYPSIQTYGGAWHLFIRDWQGGDTSTLIRYISTNEGGTWGAETVIATSADRQSYWVLDSDGSRIDLAFSDGRNPPDADPVTIGHVYYDGTWRKSDGSSAGSLPLEPSDMSEVYDASDGMGWPMDIVTLGGGPVFTYAVLNDPSSNSWRRAHWTGSAWVNRTIDESDGDIDSGFASCVVLDHLNPDRAYAPTYVGGNWRMNRYATSDGGATWNLTTIASGATDHIIPGAVYNSSGAVRVLWMTGGPYAGYLDGGFGLMAGR